MHKTALILGIGGQDGSYLAELLVSKGYEVHGLARHCSYDNLSRVKPIITKLKIHRGDVTDISSIQNAYDRCLPDEIYNLADQDNVGWSKEAPLAQIDVTYKGCANMLEVLAGNAGVRVFQPISSTMFGLSLPPQDEVTPHEPLSPYAVAKTACYHLCRYYRREYDLKVCCGIMFNHDSPRRSPNYLLQDICRQSVEVARVKRKAVEVGNLGMKIDIGFAGDYVRAMWLMLQLSKPDDYCVGTGESHTLKRLIQLALTEAGVSGNQNDYMKENPELLRGGAQNMIARINKIFNIGWAPTVGMESLVKMIVKKYREQ